MLTENCALAVLDSTETFPIDFDDVWQWLEYSRKDAALRSFRNAEFVESLDFTVLHRNVEKASEGIKEAKYYLTIDCFKSFCMMANTEKGREVRQYFLRIEKEWLKHKAETIAHGGAQREVEPDSEILAVLKTIRSAGGKVDVKAYFDAKARIERKRMVAPQVKRLDVEERVLEIVLEHEGSPVSARTVMRHTRACRSAQEVQAVFQSLRDRGLIRLLETGRGIYAIA